MVNAHTARSIVGIIGNVISFGLFVSPCPTFWRIWKNKSVEEFKPDPYLATVMNCLFWVFYGLPFVHPDSTLVVTIGLTINGIGLVLELFYLTLFYIYGDNKKRKKMSTVLAVEAIIMVAIAAVTTTVFHSHAKRSTFVGAFCVAFGILMYASPLTVMYKVLRDKSVEYMPFWLSLASFANGIVWVAYALLQFDLYILISNGTGAALGVIQLLLWIYYRAIYPKCCAGDASQTDIELAATKAQDQV
uniref:Bidirectional sugar transporter SWEET n=1 Tax=Kalanchoe fedtschenkoi TaxID=63787 RepID=A0A7N0UDM1_KALFE